MEAGTGSPLLTAPRIPTVHPPPRRVPPLQPTVLVLPISRRNPFAHEPRHRRIQSRLERNAGNIIISHFSRRFVRWAAARCRVSRISRRWCVCVAERAAHARASEIFRTRGWKTAAAVWMTGMGSLLTARAKRWGRAREAESSKWVALAMDVT